MFRERRRNRDSQSIDGFDFNWDWLFVEIGIE